MNRQIAEELAFNFRAYGRLGGGDRIQLTPAQARTAARTPEVMVKVLSSGATSAKAVRRHIDYVARTGEVELQTTSIFTMSAGCTSPTTTARPTKCITTGTMARWRWRREQLQ